MPPGVETWGFVENLAGLPAAATRAMTISWPPYGRWAAGYGTEREGAVLGAEDRRSPARSATPCRPAAIPSSPPASRCGVPRPARRRMPAYLFIQWLNSEDISIQRVQLPYALRDPFRDQPLHQPEYKSRWPQAPEYLAALQAGAVRPACSTCRSSRPTSTRRPCARASRKLWAGEDPKAILDDVAAQWDALTAAGSASTSSRPPTRRGLPSRRLSEDEQTASAYPSA